MAWDNSSKHSRKMVQRSQGLAPKPHVNKAGKVRALLPKPPNPKWLVLAKWEAKKPSFILKSEHPTLESPEESKQPLFTGVVSFGRAAGSQGYARPPTTLCSTLKTHV